MDSSGETGPPAWREVGRITNVLGAALSALSIFLLLQRVINFEINGTLHQIIATYKWIFHDTLLGFVWGILNLEVAPWVNDIVVLWSAMTAVSFRTFSKARFWANSSRSNDTLGLVETPLGE